MPAAIAISLSLGASCAVAADAGGAPARRSTPAATTAPASAPAKAPRRLADVLEPIRRKASLPALAAAVIHHGRLAALDAVGVRKAGSDVKVTPDDQFHLGSCTKAMTATLIAMLVERGKLHWDTPLAKALPDLASKMQPAYRTVTLMHLLSHRAGIIPNWPAGRTVAEMWDLPGGPRRQREAFAAMVLAATPVCKPGEEYHYSNAGYSIAAAVAERATDTPWETLMRRMIFKPLEMTSAGFGAMGSAGRIDQPWQHRLVDGKAVPVEPGPRSDNPPVIAPGGRVHSNLADWAKFVQAHLAGARGEKTPLKLTARSWTALHTPPFGGDYALGWGVCRRLWAGGTAWNHAGSNTMNYAVVWAAPKYDFAVLVATNIAGKGVPEAVDRVAATLIGLFPPSRPLPAGPGSDGNR